MNWVKKNCCVVFLLASVLVLIPPSCLQVNEKIGVLYVLHGGMDTLESQYMWNASVMMFSYDQNHAVHKLVIWNSAMWPSVLDTETTDFAARFIRKYIVNMVSNSIFTIYPPMNDKIRRMITVPIAIEGEIIPDAIGLKLLIGCILSSFLSIISLII